MKLYKRLIFSLILLCVFTSCKTVKSVQGVIEPFGIIGDDADIYVYIPIKEHKKIVESALPLAAGNDMKKALARTDVVYSGICFDIKGSEVRICAKGNYPHKMSDSAFTKKNGWIPKKTEEGIKYYTSPYADISIPLQSLVCMDLGAENRKGMEELLSRMKKSERPVFSKKFDLFIQSDSKDIGIFVKNPDFFLSGIFGIKLGLPLGQISMYLKKDSNGHTAEQNYIYNLYIETENKNTAFAAKIILQKLLGLPVLIDNDFLIIENGSISEEKIIKIIKSMYPY